jgi:hypothetical protein
MGNEKIKLPKVIEGLYGFPNLAIKEIVGSPFLGRSFLVSINIHSTPKEPEFATVFLPNGSPWDIFKVVLLLPSSGFATGNLPLEPIVVLVVSVNCVDRNIEFPVLKGIHAHKIETKVTDLDASINIVFADSMFNDTFKVIKATVGISRDEVLHKKLLWGIISLKLKKQGLLFPPYELLFINS